MFQSPKGFTMIETVAATTTLFLALIIVIPSFILIQQERNALYNEINIINHLETTLTQQTYDDEIYSNTMTDNINGISITLTFTVENDLQKGCVQWETNQRTEKSFCLYRKYE